MHWTKKQITIIAIIACTSFMSTFLISSVNIALPAIERTFSLNAVSLSWVVTSFLLATAMFLLPVGRFGDLMGTRKLFKAGVIIFTLSSLLSSIAWSGMWLIIFRYIQGIGTALTSTTGPAILMTLFLPKYRGRVLGISVSAVYLGLAIGPFAGGFLTEVFGWRSLFYVSTVLGICISIIGFLFLDKDIPTQRAAKKINVSSSFFYMAGLVMLVYGSSQIPYIFGWLLLGSGVLSLIFFWILESRSMVPVLDTKLYTENRLFAYSNLAALINYSATFAIIFLLSLYLQKIKGMSPYEAGTILIAQPVVMAVFSPVTGRLSDFIQPRYLSTLGMSMCTLGLISFSLINASTPVWMIVISLLWVGLGFAFFSSPNMNTIMSSVNHHQYGIASGSASTMRVIGQIISMTIAILFFAGMFGGQAIETVEETVFLQALKWGFISFSFLSMAGIYFSYNRGKIKR